MKNLEQHLFELSLLTFILWLNPFYNTVVGLIVYGCIFIFFAFRKYPIEAYFVVTLFSVMSMNHIPYLRIDAVLISILFLYTIYQAKKNGFVAGYLLLIIIIQLLYSFIAIFYTPIKEDGMIGFTAMLEGIAVYIIVTNTRLLLSKKSFMTFSKVSSFLMFTLTLEMFVIYCKVGFYAIAHNKDLLHLGWGFSNTIAVIFVFLLPVAFYKYMVKNRNRLYIILDLLSIIGFLLTLSRGAYLGVVITFGLVCLYYFNRQKLFSYASLFMAVLLVFIVLKQTKNTILIFYQKLSSYLLYDSHRFELYNLAYQSFRKKIVFGNGMKSSKYLIHTYTLENNAHFHNYILQTMATLGLVGLILLLIFFIRLFTVLKGPKNLFFYCLTFGIIGELIHQLVDISFNKYFFGILFYGFVGLIEIARNQNKDDSFKMKLLKINKVRK